jgi:putative transposase
MVRAGVVGHPSEWQECGYHEIFNPRQCYAMINHPKLVELAMVDDLKELKDGYAGWLPEMLLTRGKGREDKWSTSIAVGSE